MTRDHLLGNRTYDILNYLALLVLPAVGTLYFTLAQIWDLSHGEEVVGTITALVTFFGVLLKISSKSYNNSEAKYNGEVVVKNFTDDDGLESSSLGIHLGDDVYIDRLGEQNELRLKVREVNES